MIKTLTSLILLISMIFGLSAYMGVFKFRQYKVRKEIKALLKNSVPDSLKISFTLAEISADPSQITWMHDKEFRYKNEMYDIVSQTITDKGVVLTCIKDVKESGLFAELDAMLETQMNKDPYHHNSKSQWLKLFQSLYSQIFESHLVLCNCPTEHFFHYSLKHSNYFLKRLFHPPKW
jgi:hypothetical protein